MVLVRQGKTKSNRVFLQVVVSSSIEGKGKEFYCRFADGNLLFRLYFGLRLGG